MHKRLYIRQLLTVLFFLWLFTHLESIEVQIHCKTKTTTTTIKAYPTRWDQLHGSNDVIKVSQNILIIC